jgi:hypothetical protein
LKAAVRKRLGYDPFFPAARQTIVVEIVDQEGDLRAQMRLVDESGMIIGSRELREKFGQCDELVASLALAISIALDPSAALGEAPGSATQPDSAEPAPGETEPEPKRDSIAQEHPQKTSEPSDQAWAASAIESNVLEVAGRAAVFADLGSAPRLAFGWHLGVDLRRNWFRLVAEFLQQPTAKATVGGAYEARVSLLAGTLAPCLTSDIWAGCALLTSGVLQSNVTQPANSSSFYLALGARLEYAPTLFDNLQLLAQFDAVKPLTPVSLSVRTEEVWRTSALTFAVGIGLKLRFR